VRRDLLHWIRQRVKGFVALVAQHLVLHGNDGLQKDIVERFGFHAHVQLLDAKRKAPSLLFARTKDNVETGLRQTGELAEAGSKEKKEIV